MGIYYTGEQSSAPSAPSSGYVALYFKSDGLMYWKDDAGNEYAPVYSGGSATFVDLTVTGNTIIGNAIGDALTVNAGAWTLGNAVTVTGTWANLGTITTADINGGTIDGAVIGGSSAAAGSFTTLTCQSPFIVTGTNLGAGSSIWFGSDTNGGGAINVPTGEVFLGLVNQAEVIRYSSTGLAVTGAISSTGNITLGNGTATVATILDGDGSANSGAYQELKKDSTRTHLIGHESVILAGGSTSSDLLFWAAGATAYKFNLSSSSSPTVTINSTGLAVTGALSCSTNLTVTGGTITTGSTTALSLATSGGTQFNIGHAASASDYWQAQGSNAAGAEFYTIGGTNVNGFFKSKGTGYFSFATAYDAGGPEQVRITHTASANRYITLTGSNGGNPAISVSAGELAVGTNAWTFGVANSVSPTSPNRTLTVTIGGTTYYIAAKTTND